MIAFPDLVRYKQPLHPLLAKGHKGGYILYANGKRYNQNITQKIHALRKSHLFLASCFQMQLRWNEMWTTQYFFHIHDLGLSI